jgi:hypothetical protein
MNVEISHAKEILNSKACANLIKQFLLLMNKSVVHNKQINIILNPTGTKIKDYLKPLYSPAYINEEVEFEESINLCIKYGILDCEYKDKKITFPLYKRKANLIFNKENEIIFRKFLNMEISNYLEQWYASIKESNIDDSKKELLLNLSPIEYKGKSAKDIINRIELYLKENRKNDFVREVSAHIFYGHSKMLDNKQDYWEIFGIRQSPIQILIHNGTNTYNVLFIENKQTFESLKLKQKITDNYILVYLSGFMGTAARLKVKEHRAFYQSGLKTSEYNFHSIFDEQESYKYFFWGDFDYEGLNIFLSLKKIFKKLEFWNLGYDNMIKMVKNNHGHSKHASKKERQRKPNEDEMNIVNNYYLNIMDNHGFYDQEGILI